MREPSAFEFRHYKDFLRSKLRSPGKRGALSQAAKALNCQRSYLSRVMNSKIQLTPDHAYLLARHWQLAPPESEYFLTMVDEERAASREFRAYLAQRLEALLRSHESLGTRMERSKPVLAVEQEIAYFSAWHWSAIHFLTSIPAFQTADQIAIRLCLAKPLVEHCLRMLADWGLVRANGPTWEYLSGEFHLPKDSPLVCQYHGNWRSRALLDAQIPHTNGIHYTNVQTLAINDVPALRALALEFIEKCKLLTRPSRPEEAVAITLDVFHL